MSPTQRMKERKKERMQQIKTKRKNKPKLIDDMRNKN